MMVMILFVKLVKIQILKLTLPMIIVVYKINIGIKNIKNVNHQLNIVIDMMAQKQMLNV